MTLEVSRAPADCSARTSRLVIAVDLYPLVAGVSGGIVPWVRGVLGELARLYPMDQLMLFHRPGRPPLQFEGPNVRFVGLDEDQQIFYDKMSRYCKNAEVRAVIRTYPQELHPDLPFEQQVFLIPDMQHEFFPDFFSREELAARRRAFAYALSRGGAIGTMTEYSRSTVVESPWNLCRDVFLLPAALPEELPGKRASLPERVRIFDRFFYMPANLWLHKNHRRLFEAFRLSLPGLPPKTGLVLTGNPRGYDEAIKGYEELPILHLGFVPAEQVSALFCEAVALVYFSLFEGFGIPLLEAFHHGTPVLCSNSSSLREVGGECVLACDPTDVDAMAELMGRIVKEPGLRERVVTKALGRLSAYDWATPARNLRGALERVATPNPALTMPLPLITIVMPTRNQGQFIRASIDSVLGQSYPNVELIVMDGASTDDTVEILRSYGDRISWVSKEDRGQADAINRGMAQAKGSILAYLNSDDVLLPGALQTVAVYFDAHRECDMVYGRADYIDKDGRVIGAYATADYTFERLMRDCCVCQPAAFWRRRISERVGEFNAELQTAMDYEYWLRIANAGGIIHHAPERLAQSQLHEDTKTLGMRGKIFQEVFKICEEHGGYVSYNYYQGFWAYRLYESWSGGNVLQRIIPKLYVLPALLHFCACDRKQTGRQRAHFLANVALKAIDRKSPLVGRWTRKVGRSSLGLWRTFN